MEEQNLYTVSNSQSQYSTAIVRRNNGLQVKYTEYVRIGKNSSVESRYEFPVEGAVLKADNLYYDPPLAVCIQCSRSSM